MSVSVVLLLLCVLLVFSLSLLSSSSMTPYIQQQQADLCLSVSLSLCVPSFFLSFFFPFFYICSIHPVESEIHCCIRMTCATKGHPKLHPTCLLYSTLFNPSTIFLFFHMHLQYCTEGHHIAPLCAFTVCIHT